MPNRSNTAGTLAYLALVVESDTTCYGGLLAIDSLGRPVEFHCSAPLTPSRAHSILYGPTLRSHLTDQVVAPALLRALRRRPAALLVDHREQLALRSQVHYPVLHVEIDAAGTARSSGVPVSCHEDHAGDRRIFERVWSRFEAQVELCEPFERIRAALREARGGTKAA